MNIWHFNKEKRLIFREIPGDRAEPNKIPLKQTGENFFDYGMKKLRKVSEYAKGKERKATSQEIAESLIWTPLRIPVFNPEAIKDPEVFLENAAKFKGIPGLDLGKEIQKIVERGGAIMKSFLKKPLGLKRLKD